MKSMFGSKAEKILSLSLIVFLCVLCASVVNLFAGPDWSPTQHFTGFGAYSFDGGPIFAVNLPTMPEQYGAKGDGVTDDTAAIQAAINNTVPGGAVWFSEKTYLSKTLTIGRAVNFWSRSGQATIQANGIGTNDLIDVNASNVSFHCLTVNANGQGGNGISVAVGLSGFVFDQVTVENAAQNGVFMTSDSRLLVTNSIFKGNGVNQFYMTQASAANTNEVQILDSIFDDTGGGASRFCAILFDQYFSNATLKHVVIANNIIRYTGLGSSYETDGLVVSGTNSIQDVTIMGNVIELITGSTTGNDLELGGIVQGSVTGNTFMGGQVGVCVEHNDTNITVNENTFNSIAYQAVLLNSGSPAPTDIAVNGNIISGVYAGVNVQGGENIVINNNQIDMNATTAGSGIRFTCNVNCIDVTANGNNIDGASNAGTFGFYFGNNSGSASKVSILGDTLARMGYGFVADKAPTSGLIADLTFDTVTSSYNGLGNLTNLQVRDLNPIAFTNLPSVPAAGSSFYCSNCTTAATCAGSGSGHLAVSNGTAWTCQ